MLKGTSFFGLWIMMVLIDILWLIGGPLVDGMMDSVGRVMQLYWIFHLFGVIAVFIAGWDVSDNLLNLPVRALLLVVALQWALYAGIAYWVVARLKRGRGKEVESGEQNGDDA